MSGTKRTRAHASVCAAAFLVFSGTSAAQTTYPVKPIRIVIGTPAGGGSEISARLLGDVFTRAWGQPFIVEPRPGASGNIAAEYVAKAAPDGYTLYVCYGSHTVNPSIYPRAGYEPIKDFTPITVIATQYNALVVHPSIPVKTVGQLVALAKSHPGAMSYSSSGNGAPNHLGMELFKIAAKIDIVHIPYKGAAPSRIDFLGGHVHTMFDVLRTALPYHEAGKSRILAVASLERSALAPQLPTIAENGYKDIEVKGWHGLLGPAGMPAALVNQIQGEIARALLEPAMKEKLFKSGIDVAATSPAEMDAFMRADVARWRSVVQAARIRAD